MNRGFKTYYSKALKESIETFKHKKSYTEYYLYLVSSVFLRIFLLLFSPVVQMSDFRLARIARNNNNLSTSEAYSSFDNIKKFLSACLMQLFLMCIFLGSLVILSIVIVFLAWIGYILCSLLSTNLSTRVIIAIIFAFPAALWTLIFIISYYFWSTAAFYIYDSVNDVTISDAIKYSFKVMRSHQRGTFTAFLNVLVPNILKVIYLSIVACATILPVILGWNTTPIVICFAISIIMLILYIIIAPKLTLTSLIANTYLFDDLFIESPEGKIDSKNRIKDDQALNYQGDLLKLFDKTENMVEVQEYRKNKVVETDPKNAKKEIKDIDIDNKAFVEIVGEEAKKLIESSAIKDASNNEKESEQTPVEENNIIIEEQAKATKPKVMDAIKGKVTNIIKDTKNWFKSKIEKIKDKTQGNNFEKRPMSIKYEDTIIDENEATSGYDDGFKTSTEDTLPSESTKENIDDIKKQENNKNPQNNKAKNKNKSNISSDELSELERFESQEGSNDDDDFLDDTEE